MANASSNKFYGEYRSSTTSQTGCIKKFVTVKSDSLRFPAQLAYVCDLCNKSHGFWFARAWAVNTQKQGEAFEKYCTSNGVETEVSI